MATVVAENPSYIEPSNSEETHGGKASRQMSRLPDLNPIQEDPDGETDSRPQSRVSRHQGKEDVQLPPIVSGKTVEDISTEKLMEALVLSGADEKSLGVLLKNVRAEVKAALEELTTITTHDDNLEKQYRETVSENENLQLSLERARKEVRHLKGQLSILQMTPSAVREERARTQTRDKKRQELEKQAQRARSQLSERGTTVQVLTAAQRARTVNAKGEYIDVHSSKNKSHHSRRSTYPNLGSKVKQAPPSSLPAVIKSKVEPLPPPLVGCTCSECNAQQSLGALTLNRTLCQHQASNQITKSGQQILLGDRVVLRGERLGMVCYIGRLDFDLNDHIYIGVHLDMPVGNIDGYLKGRRYFQCPPNHGVMVKSHDIVCVTGRKPVTGGTAVPRVRERLPTGFELSRSASQASKISVGSDGLPSTSVHSSHSTLCPTDSAVESELVRLEGSGGLGEGPGGLGEESVNNMTRRIQQLSQKSSKKAKELQRLQEELKLRSPPTPPPTKVALDESVNITVAPPPPRPVTPPPLTPTPSHTTQPSRPPTPLEQTLLELLSDKDLGSTGFVTTNELAAALTQLSGPRALSSSEVTDLLTNLGVVSDEGVGIPYHSLVPHITQALGAYNQE